MPKHTPPRDPSPKEEPRKFKTGAIPTPRAVLLRAEPFVPEYVATAAYPVAYVPARLSVWGNDQYGDCVTAEEAFAKACHEPEIFIDDQTVIQWAERHDWLNGAYLTEVMDAMQSDGFQVGSQRYNDGKYLGVDYSDEAVLQAALNVGPVKIAIDSSALPREAMSGRSGWVALQGGRHPNTDHSVAITGFGTAKFLFAALKVAVPREVQPDLPGYLLFTWGTIGFVSHDWLMGTCTEAWVRNPTTVGVPPIPEPGPPPPPTPPTPPPGPTPGTLSFYAVDSAGRAWTIHLHPSSIEGCGPPLCPAKGSEQDRA